MMRFAIMFLMILFSVNHVIADGEGPPRPVTQAEKEYYSKLYGTLEQALPQAPSGWTVVSKPNMNIPETVPAGSEKSSFITRISGKWFDDSQKKRLEQKTQEAAMKAGPPSQADLKRIEDAMNEQRKLYEEFQKAAAKGDQETVKKIQAQLVVQQSITKQAMASMNAPYEKAQQEYAIKDACLEVQIEVNQYTKGIKDLKSANIPGLTMAFIHGDGNKDIKDFPYDSIVAFLGPWKETSKDRGYTYFRAKLEPGQPHTSMKTFMIVVKASEQRAFDYLKSVKWPMLQAILVK
ncbi:MAG: hypothetical protein NTY64_17080 [Deltaproteobacteria bacterium]|nr:hypothetical protein [Deltaproteobacteria bacterium]